MSRPEHIGPPDMVYNDIEATKYTSSTRIAEIQAEMSLRALELLNLPAGEMSYILDVGCGSGLSGEILEEEGHMWVGFDISPSMLNVAVEREVEGDLFLQDAGQGLSFRPGTFDACISISVLQWLCNADQMSHNPRKRLLKFFTTLFTCLKRGARAVFQFYPENDAQIEMIMTAAMKCGFTGGLVIDYPNSNKARKHYLTLFAGPSMQPVPQGLEFEQNGVAKSAMFSGTRKRLQHSTKGKGSKKAATKSKEWIMNKKELFKARGKKVANDSKYTGRKRGPKF